MVFAPGVVGPRCRDRSSVLSHPHALTAGSQLRNNVPHTHGQKGCMWKISLSLPLCCHAIQSYPIHLAASKGNTDITKLLRQHGATGTNSQHCTTHASHQTARDIDSHLTYLRLCVRGAHVSVNDSDESGSTPLHYAAARHHTDYLKWLLHLGTYPPVTQQRANRQTTKRDRPLSLSLFLV